MLAAFLAILHGAVSTLRTHRDLLAEIAAALRQQLAIYKRTVLSLPDIPSARHDLRHAAARGASSC